MTPTQPWRAGFDEWDANHSNAVGLDAHQVAIEEAWAACDARWRKAATEHRCCKRDGAYPCESDCRCLHSTRNCAEAILEEVDNV